MNCPALHLSEAHSDMQKALALLCSLSQVRMLLAGEPSLPAWRARSAPRLPAAGATAQLRIMGLAYSCSKGLNCEDSPHA